MKPTMTHEIARAASKDAGNQSMRNAGRSTWNRDDFNAAVAKFRELQPCPIEDLIDKFQQLAKLGKPK